MKFSLIIPVYNVAAYLPACLDSVLAQTFCDWEAICVDDGSTDGSGELLDGYAQRDARFVVIHQKNGGVSVARNAGLAVARGDYVGFVDADDCLCPDWLQVVDATILAYSADLYRFRYTKIPEDYCNEGLHQVSDSRGCQHYLGVSECLPRVLELVFDGGFSFLYFVRRELIAGITFPVGVWMHEDCLFFIQIAMRVNAFCRSFYPGYLYRLRASSACGKSKFTDGLEYFTIVQRLNALYETHREFFAQLGLSQQVFDVFSAAICCRLAVGVERCLAANYPGNAAATIARVETLFRESAFHRKPSRFRLPIERARYKLVRHAKVAYRFRALIRLKRAVIARARRAAKRLLGRGAT